MRNVTRKEGEKNKKSRKKPHTQRNDCSPFPKHHRMKSEEAT